MDNIVKGTIIRNVCDRSGIRADKIGKIEILREFSFIEVDARIAEKVIKAMRHAKIDGREIRLQYAEKGGKKNNRPKKKSKK
jgi:ATP-dependent RNA helicase DeaD